MVLLGAQSHQVKCKDSAVRSFLNDNHRYSTTTDGTANATALFRWQKSSNNCGIIIDEASQVSKLGQKIEAYIANLFHPGAQRGLEMSLSQHRS